MEKMKKRSIRFALALMMVTILFAGVGTIEVNAATAPDLIGKLDFQLTRNSENNYTVKVDEVKDGTRLVVAVVNDEGIVRLGEDPYKQMEIAFLKALRNPPGPKYSFNTSTFHVFTVVNGAATDWNSDYKENIEKCGIFVGLIDNSEQDNSKANIWYLGLTPVVKIGESGGNHIGETTYGVTVNEGTTTSSSAYKNDTVHITANAAPSGQHFKEWTGADSLTFTSGGKTSATAAFTMPANAVTLTATYEDDTTTASTDTTTKKDAAPKTGDNTPIVWLFVVALISGGGTILLAKKKNS